ncbi:Right handed beta helix region [Paenibacillus sp. UNCCL117]|uniref:right-handed parallel beta-helix repeat-containing protein n=1 Tax=unclassified Paenibacillus TaxID=185978 RepID=UPI000885DB6A|nr:MULTISPECIES: right-handed parallel beta-helix repeat-containing protein [unclassified Paenibacillus]SDD98042.1 Right handed beta helix region [Paenibacillus sp. cl123]SFW56051.1 Right handed beta helix region [Paenibacillus sp. UNCCL117]
MSKDSDTRSEATWSRRKLLAAMGTTAAGLMLGGGGQQLAAAAALPPGAPGSGNAAGWLNVKDYGAKGNGFAYENDAPAIQAAIHAAGQGRFGGTVYLPAGTYLIDASVVLLSNVHLVGDGFGATMIKSTRASMPLLLGHQVKKAIIERLSFEGQGMVVSADNQLVERGIDLKDCEQVLVRNCSFHWIVNGIGVKNSRRVTIEDCSFDRFIPIDNTSHGYGIYMEGGEHNLMQNNRFMQLENSCIYVSAGCSHSVIAGNVSEQCKAPLVTVSSPLKSCAYLRIGANQVSSTGLAKGETSGKHGIVLKGYCIDNVIEGNRIARVAETGILLEGDAASATERLSGNQITGNQLIDCPTGIALVNGDANAVTGNDVRRSKAGIRLAVQGEKEGSYCRDNVITGNTLFRCTEAGVQLASPRCQANAVFGNGGAANGEAISDKGQDTVRTGF